MIFKAKSGMLHSSPHSSCEEMNIPTVHVAAYGTDVMVSCSTPTKRQNKSVSSILSIEDALILIEVLKIEIAVAQGRIKDVI